MDVAIRGANPETVVHTARALQANKAVEKDRDYGGVYCGPRGLLTD